jgi:hypothetical protein
MYTNCRELFNMKPVFIPLKSKHYEAFESGTKHSEFRIYGPRWNEKTCIPGRAVILSKGYGKGNRIYGVIGTFQKRDASGFSPAHQVTLMALFGRLDKPIAVIGIILPPRD